MHYGRRLSRATAADRVLLDGMENEKLAQRVQMCIQPKRYKHYKTLRAARERGVFIVRTLLIFHTNSFIVQLYRYCSGNKNETKSAVYFPAVIYNHQQKNMTSSISLRTHGRADIMNS